MSEKEAMHMMIMTQYLDTLKELLGTKKRECQNAPLYRAQDDVDVEFLRNMAQKKKSLR